jgi:hypothetical protein
MREKETGAEKAMDLFLRAGKCDEILRILWEAQTETAGL